MSREKFFGTWLLVSVFVICSLSLTGCDSALNKSIVLIDDNAPLMIVEPVKIKAAAEKPSGSGNWEVVGWVNVPAGYVVFKADTSPL